MCFVNRITYNICNSIMIIFLILYFSGTMITQSHTLSITYFVYFLSKRGNVLRTLKKYLTTTGPRCSEAKRQITLSAHSFRPQNIANMSYLANIFPPVSQTYNYKVCSSFTQIRRCVVFLGIYTDTLSCIVKLPDEACASHTKRVGEN